MGQQPQQQEQKPPSKGQALAWVYRGADAHCTAVSVPWRFGFGSQALGFPGLLALGLMLAYTAFAAAPEFLIYIGLWLACLIYRRIETVRLERRGVVLHSRSAGVPILARYMSAAWAFRLEPLLYMVIGAVILPLSPAIGFFIMAAFFSMLLRSAIEETVQKARVRAVNDARIEAQYYSGQMRTR